MAKGYREVRKVLKSGEVRVYRYSTATGEAIDGRPGSWGFKRDVEVARERAWDGPTVHDLLIRYQKSQEYRQLALRTKQNYNEHIEWWRSRHAGTPIKQITRPMLSAARDEMLDTPGKCSLWVAFTKLLFNYAVDQDMLPANPATRLKKPKLGTIKRWPEDQIDSVIAALPPYLRAIAMLALYTGQRLGDVIAMRWSDYHGTHIMVSQEKTGQDDRDESMVIPCHPALTAFLDPLPRRGELICTTFGGGRWDQPGASARMRLALDALGMRGYSTHGLRKSSTARLAEAGCSTKEIQAISGHKTLTEVERYTREAQQAVLAQSAMDKLVGNRVAAVSAKN